MKTKLQQAISKVAPNISIRTIWEHDNELLDIREECDGFDNEDPDDWQAWQSEVRALAVINGDEVSGSGYLGGTWERAGDMPEVSNPEISGYEPQMTKEAIDELQGLVPESETILHGQILAAISLLKPVPA